ncbi:hypothetical protein [Sporosarcina cyprini]|nr:hypothetical protein [Sporosarcina cyprini]
MSFAEDRDWMGSENPGGGILNYTIRLSSSFSLSGWRLYVIN